MALLLYNLIAYTLHLAPARTAAVVTTSRFFTGTFYSVGLLALSLAVVARAQPPAGTAVQDAATQAPEVSGYELNFPAMGTLLAFQAFSDDDAQVARAFADARREVERLAEILSDYGAETETVLLSRPEKVGQWQVLSPELWEVLQVCDRWHRQSDGAFDASIGRL